MNVLQKNNPNPGFFQIDAVMMIMNAPPNIERVIKQIKESEDRWKALYMAMWGESYRVRDEYKDTESWVKPIRLGLPASKQGYHTYTPKELHNILVSMDREIALNHLTTMFSLLEKLVKEMHGHLYPKNKPVNAGKRQILINFLRGENPYEKITDRLLLAKEEPEFILARETRNCVIHNGGQIDKNWVEAFENARGTNHAYNIGDNIPDSLRDVEDWHALFIRITERVQYFLGIHIFEQMVGIDLQKQD